MKNSKTITGKIAFYNKGDQTGMIRTEGNNLIPFSATSVRHVLDYTGFNPGKGVKVTFNLSESSYRGPSATEIELVGSKKVTRFNTKTKNPFRSNVMFERILDVYMDACRQHTTSDGWDKYYEFYFFNPSGNFIHFPKMTLKFFKSKQAKKDYEASFNEKGGCKIVPKLKRGLRNAIKRELLERIGARDIYGNHLYSSEFDRLEKCYLESFNSEIKIQFKLKDDYEVYTDLFFVQATSKQLAIQKALQNVLVRNSHAEVLSYRVVA